MSPYKKHVDACLSDGQWKYLMTVNGVIVTNSTFVTCIVLLAGQSINEIRDRYAVMCIIVSQINLSMYSCYCWCVSIGNHDYGDLREQSCNRMTASGAL